MSGAFIPDDTRLPFFAYGVFQPGQLGFLRLKQLVSGVQAGCLRGRLYERDGLPMLVPDVPEPAMRRVTETNCDGR